MIKKKNQLGMNPSTARSRLIKKLLFEFAVKEGHVCHRCGKPLDENSFSVDHKVPWLDSEDPQGLFFDSKNIAYSHLKCNSGDARKPHKKYFTKEEKKAAVSRNNRNYYLGHKDR